jgi:hypothetical protein
MAPECWPHEASIDEWKQAQQVEQHKGEGVVVEGAGQHGQVVTHAQLVGGVEK